MCPVYATALPSAKKRNSYSAFMQYLYVLYTKITIIIISIKTFIILLFFQKSITNTKLLRQKSIFLSFQ